MKKNSLQVSGRFALVVSVHLLGQIYTVWWEEAPEVGWTSRGLWEANTAKALSGKCNPRCSNRVETWGTAWLWLWRSLQAKQKTLCMLGLEGCEGPHWEDRWRRTTQAYRTFWELLLRCIPKYGQLYLWRLCLKHDSREKETYLRAQWSEKQIVKRWN